MTYEGRSVTLSQYVRTAMESLRKNHSGEVGVLTVEITFVSGPGLKTGNKY